MNGVKALALAPALNAQLDPTAQALLNLSNNAPARLGVQYLTQFNTTLGPPLSFITPAQSVCNYASILFSNAASLASYNDGVANGQRFIVLQPPLAEGSQIGPSSGPSNGQGGLPTNFLHYNPYPNTAVPGADARVRGGQRGLPGRSHDRERPGQPGHPHRGPDPSAGREAGQDQEEEGQEVTPDERATQPPAPQRKDYDERIYRKGNPPHRIRNALILIVLVVIGVYLALTKSIPFQSHFSSTPSSRTRRTSARTPRSGSPASTWARSRTSRASVATVSPGTARATTRMSPSRSTPTVSRSTATPRSTIRPRLFLEGNFFLDLEPGQPERPQSLQRRHDPGHPDRHRGPARPDPDLAPASGPRQPAEAARGLRHRSDPQADRRRRRDPGPGGPGPDRRAGDQQVLQLRGRPQRGTRRS